MKFKRKSVIITKIDKIPIFLTLKVLGKILMEQNNGTNDKMKFVFISHKNDVQPDADMCLKLYDYLTSEGICCWMDRKDMRYGSWKAQIIKNIGEASAFVLMQSENSLLSEQVHIEIERLKEFNGKRQFRCPIIPFALDDAWDHIDEKARTATGVMQERLNTTIHNIGMGSDQKVILKKHETTQKAFEELKGYLLQAGLLPMKNNPADFSVREGVLVEYTGQDSFVEIPIGVREIGEQAFINNGKLLGVKIPEGVVKIGKRAFFGCGGLSQIDGMKGVREVDESAFTGSGVAPDDDSPYVVNGVLSGGELDGEGNLPAARLVADNAFFGCDAQELVFKEGLQAVGDGAFSGCYRLRRVVFPSSLEAIGAKAFSGCGKLQEAVFKGTAPENIGEIFKTAKITEEK